MDQRGLPSFYINNLISCYCIDPTIVVILSDPNESKGVNINMGKHTLSYIGEDQKNLVTNVPFRKSQENVSRIH